MSTSSSIVEDCIVVDFDSVILRQSKRLLGVMKSQKGMILLIVGITCFGCCFSSGITLMLEKSVEIIENVLSSRTL